MCALILNIVVIALTVGFVFVYVVLFEYFLFIKRQEERSKQNERDPTNTIQRTRSNERDPTNVAKQTENTFITQLSHEPNHQASQSASQP